VEDQGSCPDPGPSLLGRRKKNDRLNFSTESGDPSKQQEKKGLNFD